jgi:hypothetical protein
LRLSAAFLIVFAVVTGLLHAREPDPPGTYMGREIAQTMHFTGAEWLTRESRQREEDCATMLKELNLTRGQTICDLGCGNGSGPWSRKGAHHAYRRQMARPTRMAVRRGVQLDPASHTSLTFMCVSVVTHK